MVTLRSNLAMDQNPSEASEYGAFLFRRIKISTSSGLDFFTMDLLVVPGHSSKQGTAKGLQME